MRREILQDQDYVEHADILRFARRFSFVLIACICVFALGAIIYVLQTQPTYTARAQILIDTSASQVLRDRPGSPEPTLDTAKVEGQLAVLRSETIAQSVIDTLNLKNDPEFMPDDSAPSLFRKAVNSLKNLFASSSTVEGEADFIKTRVAVGRFEERLSVSRVGLSYAIDIFFTSKDPSKAARIANAVADAYVQDQVKTAGRAAQQSSIWLEERIDQLRSQLNAAARDAQLFRSGQSLQIGVPRVTAGPVDAPNFRSDGAAPQANSQSALVTLAELESKAQNYRKIYETYLQAFTEAVQRQSFPVSNARVITAATRPFTKSHPKSSLIVALSVVLGGLAGLAIAFLWHNLDGTVQSARQIRDRVGIDCLAQIPQLGQENKNRLHERWRTPGRQPSNTHHYKEVSAAPFSPFSGALKLVRTAIASGAKNGPLQVIGITSALPQEGKTTIAGNLSLLMSMANQRILLVDMDIHNSAISAEFAPDAKAGLVEVLQQDVDLRTVIRAGQSRNPDILPLVTSSPPVFSYDVFNSDAMRDLLTELRKHYDYIVVDMPPIRPIVDGLAIAALLDGVIVVTEWGKTPLYLLKEVSDGLKTANAHILGAVLSKMDPSLVRVPWDKSWNYRYAGTTQGLPETKSPHTAMQIISSIRSQAAASL